MSITKDLKSGNNNAIILVCAADDNYSMPLAATLRSVAVNFKSEQQLAIYVIDGGISRINKQKIIKSIPIDKVSITWLKPQKSSFKNLQISSTMTIAAYYRLLIPKLLPADINKAIYLDTDVIVRGNLEDLWNIEIGDKYLWAVQDMGAPYVSSSRGLINYKELGIPAEYKYFNSGVLIFNIQKWREENISEKVVKYLAEYKEYIRWYDQDGLNAILAGKWGELDPRWNQMPYLFQYSSFQASPFTEELFQNLVHNPFIIHFSSRDKPWHENCKHPQKEIFYQYLDNSLWSNWQEQQAVKKLKQRRMAVFHRIYGNFKQQIKSLIKA